MTSGGEAYLFVRQASEHGYVPPSISKPATASKAVPAAAGILSAAAGLAAAELAAGLFGTTATPVVVVGATFIDVIPTSVREFGIELLGTADKPVLIAGILAILGGLAAWSGIAGARSLRTGLGILGVLALVGVLAAVFRPGASVVTVLPSVTAGVVACGVLAWLLRTYERHAPVPSREEGSDTATEDSTVAGAQRRALLRAGGVVVAGSLAAGLVGRGIAGVTSHRTAVRDAREKLRLPPIPRTTPPAGVDVSVSGSTPWLTPNGEFYRIDTALSVPLLEVADWQLRVHGMVERELTLSFTDLLRRPIIHRYVTLACVSNPVGGNLAGNALWSGVPLAEILAEAKVKPGADAVKSTSQDGWTCGTPLSALTDGRPAMLAFAMNGQPLPFEHGFPVRMVVPGLYGYVSATKWVVDIEITRFDQFDAYWTTRGWAEQGPIKTASRIDVPRPGGTVPAGEVVVAGVAWAQHRGISRVEVRVDEGPWHTALLAAQPTKDSWRMWTWTWQARPGRHQLQVRATDGTGETQTGAFAPPAPDGATGWHTVEVTVADPA